MLTDFQKPLNYVGLGVIGALSITVAIYKDLYNNTLADYVDMKSKYEVCKTTKDGLRKSIEERNAIISEQKVELQDKIEELESWKSKPPQVKYKIIEKIREVKSNECNDTQNVLNGVRTIDFNQL